MHGIDRKRSVEVAKKLRETLSLSMEIIKELYEILSLDIINKCEEIDAANMSKFESDHEVEQMLATYLDIFGKDVVDSSMRKVKDKIENYGIHATLAKMSLSVESDKSLKINTTFIFVPFDKERMLSYIDEERILSRDKKGSLLSRIFNKSSFGTDIPYLRGSELRFLTSRAIDELVVKAGKELGVGLEAERIDALSSQSDSFQKAQTKHKEELGKNITPFETEYGDFTIKSVSIDPKSKYCTILFDKDGKNFQFGIDRNDLSPILEVESNQNIESVDGALNITSELNVKQKFLTATAESGHSESSCFHKPHGLTPIKITDDYFEEAFSDHDLNLFSDDDFNLLEDFDDIKFPDFMSEVEELSGNIANAESTQVLSSRDLGAQKN